MSDGFEENAEFFTLTTRLRYASRATRIHQNRAVALAPCGSCGRASKTSRKGVMSRTPTACSPDLDHTDDFLHASPQTPPSSIAFIVTDEERLFDRWRRTCPSASNPCGSTRRTCATSKSSPGEGRFEVHLKDYQEQAVDDVLAT